MIRSVGTLYAIQDLFDHLEQHLIAKDEFLSGFSKYGTSTALDVYDTASELSWICTADSGQLVPTLIGKKANQGIDRPSKLRCQLAKIIEANHPTWAALLPKGRKEAVAGFPEEIRQCFDEALLLGEISEDVISWWAQSSSVMRAIAQRMRVATGVRGERKSLFYECQRTGHTPRWQGFETSYAGYDVLSVRDSQHQEALKIEVKASDRNFRYAEIHLTEHEWITASKSVGSYLFHIWLFDEALPRLFIVDSTTIIAHVPNNQGRGRWRDTAIPLGAITHPSQAVAVPD
jgi:Domain of unknown function (DUF3883)